MSCTQDALAQLRTRHPQWGWYAPKPGMIAGALEDERAVALGDPTWATQAG